MYRNEAVATGQCIGGNSVVGHTLCYQVIAGSNPAQRWSQFLFLSSQKCFLKQVRNEDTTTLIFLIKNVCLDLHLEAKQD